MENEVWKDIPNYEGLYQVSNLGRIKSITHFVENKTTYGGIYTVRGKIINPKVDKGYYRCSLTKNKEKKMVAVHRMVAMAFIPNPENKPFINHINGNTKDNRIENLEWCTQKENVAHAVRTNLIKHYKIDMYDINDNYIRSFNNRYEIEKFFGRKICQESITRCCNGSIRKDKYRSRYRTAYGYKWKYADEELQKTN